MGREQKGVEAWRERTTEFERVLSVASSLDRPRTASWISDEACVGKSVAGETLDQLADLNVLLKNEREGESTFEPDPLYSWTQALRELLTENDLNGLIEQRAKMNDQIEGWRDEYGVGSPEELRDLVAEADEGARAVDIRESADDWELIRYRLSVVEDAIENYETYNRLVAR